jgi:hypothetical protein
LFESNTTAATGLPVLVKAWDKSPMAFDPTQPPDLVAPPVCTVVPFITALGDTADVGEQLVGGNGTWTGAPTYSRQWYRDGIAIDGQTAALYTLTDADVGGMINHVVTGTNTGGSTSAASVPVGPVVPASPLRRLVRPQ